MFLVSQKVAILSETVKKIFRHNSAVLMRCEPIFPNNKAKHLRCPVKTIGPRDWTDPMQMEFSFYRKNVFEQPKWALAKIGICSLALLRDMCCCFIYI